jgi:hypothetical protein
MIAIKVDRKDLNIRWYFDEVIEFLFTSNIPFLVSGNTLAKQRISTMMEPNAILKRHAELSTFM